MSLDEKAGVSVAGVVWGLVRRRTPLAEGPVVQQAVDRLDRAAVGSFAVAVTAVLMMPRVLVTLRSGHPDEVGAVAGAVLLLLTLVHENLRRRAPRDRPSLRPRAATVLDVTAGTGPGEPDAPGARARWLLP